MNQQDLWKLNLAIFNFGGKVKFAKYFLLNRGMFKALKRNVVLKKEENKSKSAYVLALGPSLKNVDLNKIKGDTIVVNRFFKIGNNYPRFIPTYYLMVDDQFSNKENIGDFNKAIAAYASKGTIFILNSKLAGSEYVKLLKDNQVFFVTNIDGRIKPLKEYRIDKVFPAFQNVVGAAIFLLILMNYKEIKLLGCDFNSFASTTRNHCYKDSSSKRLYPLYEELFLYSFAAKDHSDLQQVADRFGCKIVNQTKGSLIDAYPIEIDESIYNDEL